MTKNYRWETYNRSLWDLSQGADPYCQAWPLTQEAQEKLLNHVIMMSATEGALVVFDLDSTLLDNFSRQSLIMREFGTHVAEKKLENVTREDWDGWDYRTPMAKAGLNSERIDFLSESFKKFWKSKFFTSEYCVHDQEIPGASKFVEKVRSSGAQIVYVTGRQESMRAGTLSCLRHYSFPEPDSGKCRLWMKPSLAEDDDDFKRDVKIKLQSLGQTVALFDNEPTHINAYNNAFPLANSIHLLTDHSQRKVLLNAEIPSIRNFSFSI